jgi:hypothetical protein
VTDFYINLATQSFFWIVLVLMIYFVACRNLELEGKARARKAQNRKARIKRIRNKDRLQEKAKANPDNQFDHRLNGYLQSVDIRQSHAADKPEYWEAPGLELEPNQPKPISFVRYLLARICKSLYSTKN